MQVIVKVKFALEQVMKAQRENRDILLLFLLLDWGGWLTPCPCRFIPGNDPVPIVWEAGWAPGPVWQMYTKLKKITR
jgi:hypothetical protein